LRERKEDLPLLVDELLQRASIKLGVSKPTCTDNLLATLKNYDFPGNIRELETLLFDAASRSKSGRLEVKSIHERLTPLAPMKISQRGVGS
jgi:DNA-binding NtrC family response regulator